MDYLNHITGLLGNVLLITMVLTKFTPLSKYSTGVKVGLLLVFFVISLIPINDLPVAGYLRGAFGDPSIMTCLLITSYLIGQYTNIKLTPNNDFKFMMLAYAIIGMAFYPFAMGISLVDPYGWGYGSIWMAVAMLVSCTFLIWKKLSVACLLVTLCVIAYLLQALESQNLWDYVIDPMLWAYAMVCSMGTLFASLKQK